MRIGIYGGSFNPFHLAHEYISLQSIEKLKLDKLIIVPVGIPSHKKNNLEDAVIRIEIIKKIFKDNDKIIVSDIEIKNPNKSFTYDTLMKIKEDYGHDNEFFEIIGEDSLTYFNEWKHYEEILKESKLVVFKRRGYKPKFKHENVIFIDNEYIDISATEIRNRIKNKMSIKGLVNETVEKLIEKEMIDNV